MARSSSPRIIVLGVVICCAVVNAVLFGGRLLSWLSGQTATVTAAASSGFDGVRARVTYIVNRSDLAARIRSLEEENGALRAELAQFEEARRDAAFYREATGITAVPVQSALRAGIFSYNSIAGVRHAIVNRGSTDGVAVGDVVITSRGELVGAVTSVFEDHAVVMRVQDVAFEVTARIYGSDVAGLLRAGSDSALMLDLIQKDEVIQEGARVVTSGDDRFPAGLIIGTVRSVNNDAATLFQLVRVTPAVPDAVHGSVIITRI